MYDAKYKYFPLTKKLLDEVIRRDEVYNNLRDLLKESIKLKDKLLVIYLRTGDIRVKKLLNLAEKRYRRRTTTVFRYPESLDTIPAVYMKWREPLRPQSPDWLSIGYHNLCVVHVDDIERYNMWLVGELV